MTAFCEDDVGAGRVISTAAENDIPPFIEMRLAIRADFGGEGAEGRSVPVAPVEGKLCRNTCRKNRTRIPGSLNGDLPGGRGECKAPGCRLFLGSRADDPDSAALRVVRQH